MTLRFFLYTWLLGLIICSSVMAQNVPDSLQVATDSLQVAPQDSAAIDEDTPVVAQAEQDNIQKFFYRFSADGTASSGNVERLLLQLSSAFDWKPTSQFKLSSSPSFIYGQQSGKLAEREFAADIRGSFWHQKSIYGLGFVSWERSNLRNIRSRWIQAAGIGFKLVQKKNAYFSITNLILYENTDFMERTDIDVWRNSTRLLGEFSPDKAGKFNITSVVFLQPAFSMRNNFRWNGNLVLAYKMTHAISLRTKFENTYESFVVPGRKTNDFRWTIGLAIQK